MTYKIGRPGYCLSFRLTIQLAAGHSWPLYVTQGELRLTRLMFGIHWVQLLRGRAGRGYKPARVFWPETQRWS